MIVMQEQIAQILIVLEPQAVQVNYVNRLVKLFAAMEKIMIMMD